MLPKLMLAPMAGVTDAAMRKIAREMGIELAYTEMVSSRGLVYENERTEAFVLPQADDRPLGIQLFGNDPKVMASATKRLEELASFDYIDVNMGCPARKIVSNKDGCALMRTPTLAGEIIAAMRQVTNKKLSAKMRLGLTQNTINVFEVAQAVEAAGADFIIVHGRTADQMYTGKADWEPIAELQAKLSIPVIGNGDIFSLADYINKKQYALPGVMIARGIMGNPFLIRDIVGYEQTGQAPPEPSLTERVMLARRHLDYVLALKGPDGVRDFRKHAGWYFKGIPGSARYRAALSQLSSRSDFIQLTQGWLDNQV